MRAPRLRRRALLVAHVVTILLVAAGELQSTIANVAVAETGCSFQRGFKALRDQIPHIVGVCLEDERSNPSNGNAEQRTTGGLLVWRHADNWTAFTDGATTWISGPEGLAVRPNGGPLLPWETPPAAAPLDPVPASPDPTDPTQRPSLVPVLAQIPSRAAGPLAAPAPMPVISRRAPAFASGGGDPPSWANDADYATQWRSTGVPVWLAYDLSGVPADRRGRVVVAWYNNDSGAYDAAVDGRDARGIPAAYAIQANPARGGVQAPETGWVALAGVTGNTYHSRQHVVDLAGYNWVRILVTEAGAAAGGGVRFNLDVHDAGRGAQDSWIFYGDSITAGAMNASPIGPSPTFAQLVNLRVPSHFPAQEGGGIGGLRSGDGARLVDIWLAAYPGRYVGLSYGTNDARAGVSPEVFYANYESMVRAVVAAGKIPVIPKIPWGPVQSIQTNVPELNTKLDELYAAYPVIIPGPDFWAYFLERQDLISRNGVHPTAAGYAAYRQRWADTMARQVYRAE